MAKSVKSQALAGGSLSQTVLKVIQVTESIIVLQYELLPDTNPGANGNFAAIWQNTNNIPYSQTPEGTAPVTGSSQKGQLSFPVDLRQNSYIIGYSVGPELKDGSQKYGNVCSTVYIPSIPKPQSIKENAVVEADGDDPFFADLTLGVITGDTVTFKYAVPENCQPKTNKAWVGVFRGSASYNNPPEKAVAMTSNEDSGWMAINHKFVANKKYTLAYFMSGYSDTPTQTRMAVTLSFTA